MKVTYFVMPCWALALAATQSYAQSLFQRESRFNYNCLYGHGGDIMRSNTDSMLYMGVSNEQTESMNFADSISGAYLGTGYTASVGISMMHHFKVYGSVANFLKIESELSTSFVAQAGGAAGAGAGGQCVTPGNLLTLDFTTSGFNYEFFGSASHLSSGPTQPHAKAELLKWNGSNWSFLESTIFSNGVSRLGSLTAGTYRLHIQGSTKSINNGTSFASTTLVFRNLSVPEPSGFLALVGGSFLFMRRRR